MDVRNRVSVRYCGSIEGMVVTTGPPVPRCFLGHHVEGPEAIWCEASGLGRNWWSRGLNVVGDIMLHWCVCGALR